MLVLVRIKMADSRIILRNMFLTGFVVIEEEISCFQGIVNDIRKCEVKTRVL